MQHVIALLVLAGFGALVYVEYFQTYHLATVARGVLYRDGINSIREFRNSLRRVEPKTVVCLNDANEISDRAHSQFDPEVKALAERHIRLVHIPVKLGGWPTSTDVQEFLRTVEQSANQPVLVHCEQGVRRTGMFVAAYQMSIQKYDKQQAKVAIRSFGHSDNTLNDIRTFIDAYDPEKRELTGLNISKPGAAAVGTAPGAVAAPTTSAADSAGGQSRAGNP